MKQTLNRSQLLCEFDKLDCSLQHVLILIATIAKPLQQTEIMNLVRGAKWKTDRGTLLSSKINASWRGEMLQHGLIVEIESAYMCNNLIAETLARKAVNNPLGSKIKMALTTRVVPYHITNNYSEDIPLWKIRPLICSPTQGNLFETLELTPFSEIECSYSLSLIFSCDFADESETNKEWFLNTSLAFQFQVLAPILCQRSLALENIDKYLTLAEKCYQQHLQKTGQHEPMFAALLAQQYLQRNQFELLPKLLSKTLSWSIAIDACLTLIKGDAEKALQQFELALKARRKETKKRAVQLFDFENAFYLLANLVVGNTALVKKVAMKYTGQHQKENNVQLYFTFINAAQLAENSAAITSSNHTSYPIAFSALIRLYADYWFDDLTEISSPIALEELLQKAQKNNFPLFAQQAQAMLAKVSDNYQEKTTKHPALYQLITPIQKWQRSLDALKNLNDSNSGENKKSSIQAEARMIWWLDPHNYTLSPREQKLSKNGQWTKGRAVSLKKLHREIENYDYLTEADLKICSHIGEYTSGGWYGSTTFELSENAIFAAVNHPEIYWPEDNSQNIHLTNNTPKLLVSKQGKNLKLLLQPFPEAGTNIMKESDYNITLIDFNHEHHKIAEILTSKGLTVPIKAKQQVLDSISAIAPLLTIHSDIGGGNKNTKEVKSDTRLYMQISLLDEGMMKIDATTSPLGELGPSFKPGQGSKVIISEIEGKQLQTTRDLKQESQQLSSLAKIAPVLFTCEDSQWLIEDPQQALITIETLQNSEKLVLVWQKGQKIKLNKTSSASNMQLKVGKKTDWFALDGQLQIDEQTVLPLEQLLTLIGESSGRFIALKKGEYLALTEQLYQQLQRLRGVSRAGNKGIEFHPLASQAMDELSDGMQLSNSAAWKKQLTKLNQAYQLQPELPSTLQATLRDYQLQGFEWLSRLAHWQAGACLADDMGLGKTLQALAIIVNRANQGPTLVLAPTSVCLNWESEVVKFAPTLRIINFSGKDRKQKIKEATCFDIVICSYGLLQTEIEVLKEVQFTTIVADEAQAIKNPQAKRTQAAMQLQGDFKVITTGTPIENHLGELWSLFNFINPGLLGTLEQFNTQFANTIEKGDEVAADQLRTLLKPFILRRLKTEVLTELPARTEINISVKASTEELAFYEACRRQAVNRISESEESNKGSQKLKILAEITRLRQACCHPQLVNADVDISSAKQQAFIELVEELIENKHKALVFSQFVGHLTLLKEVLIKRNISFQYLDGSTPPKKRQQAVSEFQSGSGDIFLISLKAGGSGLNLTAADYVIHMDPWWNPAVEDQASDRAHRMGQQRPVTIYRMIMENSIEEKIIALHGQKRDLANNLLSGNEKVSGKLDVDQMLALLE